MNRNAREGYSGHGTGLDFIAMNCNSDDLSKIHGLNAFGARIPKISQIVANDQMRQLITKTLGSVLSHLGITIQSTDLVPSIIRLAQVVQPEADYEGQAHELLKKAGVLSRIPTALAGRAAIIANQLAPYVLPRGELVDIGCGDGTVGRIFADQGVRVSLCDTYEHSNIARTGLAFSKLSQIGTLPYLDCSVGCALVLTVFHHCDQPLRLLQEAVRILQPGGRLIVIESVFGVCRSRVCGNPGQSRIAAANSETEEFLKLSGEEQRLSNIFFDHFYNRIVHYAGESSQKVNVPFNFNTPDAWERAFVERGLSTVVIEQLGIDQPVVPEFHTLYVCDKLGA